MALRNTILLGLKNPMVYRKCLEENQDTLTADRVIEIATDIYNHSDRQRSIMQTLSTASAAATAIQQGSIQVHKLQEKCPAKDAICHNCGKKRALPEVLQKQESKSGQEQKVQTNSSA